MQSRGDCHPVMMVHHGQTRIEFQVIGKASKQLIRSYLSGCGVSVIHQLVHCFFSCMKLQPGWNASRMALPGLRIFVSEISTACVSTTSPTFSTVPSQADLRHAKMSRVRKVDSAGKCCRPPIGGLAALTGRSKAPPSAEATYNVLPASMSKSPS